MPRLENRKLPGSFHCRPQAECRPQAGGLLVFSLLRKEWVNEGEGGRRFAGSAPRREGPSPVGRWRRAVCWGNLEGGLGCGFSSGCSACSARLPPFRATLTPSKTCEKPTSEAPRQRSKRRNRGLSISGLTTGSSKKPPDTRLARRLAWDLRQPTAARCLPRVSLQRPSAGSQRSKAPRASSNERPGGHPPSDERTRRTRQN